MVVFLVDGGSSNVVVRSRNITVPNTYGILRIRVIRCGYAVATPLTISSTFILSLRVTELITTRLVTIGSTHF